MTYFSDISILGVSSLTTSENRKPVRVEIGALGIMQDSAVRILDGKTIKVDTPFVYWSVPDRVCAWQTLPGTVRTNTWFGATGERFRRMLEGLQELSEYDLLPLVNPLPFLDIVKKLEKLRNRQDRRPEIQVETAILAEQFVAEIHRLHYSRQNRNRFSQTILELAREIRENPAVTYDFRRIASRLGISYDHFRFLFHELCGCPLHEFCLTARLDAALEMLSTGVESIKEIADRCGFRDASDFTRFFRKRIGCPPSAYRNNIRL